jgi:hypothetical protein
MARQRAGERRRAGPGWLRIVFGLSFLAVAGFAVGMVAGVVWQDPGLAFAYLTGATEDVAWGGGGGDPASAEAPPVVAESPVDPQVRRDRAAEAPASADVASAPAGRLAIQVGAFSTSRAAEALAKSLRDKGYAVVVSPGAAAGESRWRVRVGPLATRSEAEATAARLKRVEKLPTWILNEDAG